MHAINEPDHILRAQPPLAEVRFDDPGSLAAHDEAGATRAATRRAGYDRATATCSNIWNAKGVAGCGSCHGIPTDNVHASITSSLQCVRCHAGTIDAQGNLSPTLHINGTVDLGR